MTASRSWTSENLMTAVTVTRHREGSGISTYTIAAKRDDRE